MRKPVAYLLWQFPMNPRSIDLKTCPHGNGGRLCSNAPVDLTAFHVPIPLNDLNQDKRRRPSRFR